VSDDADKKSVVSEVGSWIWGTIEGGFNEQQSISQIIVDALIGMIPVVGDVTAVRDLVAVILRLVERPEKRKEKLEWVTLVLLIFALIPVAGGAIKGVGKLIVAAGEDVGKHPTLIRDLVQFLNRIGEGDAVKFLKKLDFESYTSQISSQFEKLTKRLDDVLTATMKRAHAVIPDSMMARLKQIQQGVRDLADAADKMIPDALKELNRRLKAVQKKIYEGDWNEIGGAWKSVSREGEARLVETVDPATGNKTKAWQASKLPFPPSDVADFKWAGDKRYPYLLDSSNGYYVSRTTGKPTKIPTFSGPITPREIKPGEKIYRVIDGSGAVSKDGGFWSLTLPADGRTWRDKNAVLESWGNPNGYYIEFVVPPGASVWAWEGKVASQIENDASKATFGQFLAGGETQLFIDWSFEGADAAKGVTNAAGYNAGGNKLFQSQIQALPPKPTHWGATVTNVNVPDKTASVQRLAENELDTKRLAAAEAQRAAHASEDNQQQATGTGP